MSDTRKAFEKEFKMHLYSYEVYKLMYSAWLASRAQALSEAQKEIDELKSEIACYEKYGLPHNPNGN